MGQDLARLLKVVGTPSIVFFDADGVESDRFDGDRDPGHFASELRRIRSGKGTVPALLAQAPFRANDVEFTYLLGCV